MRSLIQHIRYSSTTDNSLTLSLFRFFFGVICLVQLIKFKSNLILQFEITDFRIPYDFFKWIPQLSITSIQVLYTSLIIGAVFLILGILQRVGALLVFIGLTYALLYDMSWYNNHYYLFCLISFLFIIYKADYRLSILNFGNPDRKYKQTPQYHLFIFQFQLVIVYFFGAVAKFNFDWLIHAQPIQLWLPDMYPKIYSKLSTNGAIFFAYFISWSGFLIDLTVPFLLFHKRLKWLAIVILTVFHISNIFTFSIGLFPYFGIISLVLFVQLLEIPFLKNRLFRPKKDLIISNSLNGKKRLGFVFFICWIVIQILLPLRHYVFSGNYRWNGAGYLFAWTMKLSDIEPYTRFVVKIDGDNTEYTFDYSTFNIKAKQTHFIYFHVFNTVDYANYIENWLKKKNDISEDIKVYCDGYMSLNGRSFQRKIDPNVDLTALELSLVGKYFKQHNWLVPLGNDTLIDRIVLEKLINSNSK